MTDSGSNITSTIIDLAMENLITNSTNKIIPPAAVPTLKQITRNNLNFKTLVAIILVLVYIISAPIFIKKKFYLLHQSGLCMLLGMLISLITHFITPFENYQKSLEFNDNAFFTFILPPIIFSAGYNIRVRSFFKYFHYSVFFGIFGTFLTFLIIFGSTYFCNKINLFRITFNIKDILLYSAVISSTDTVSPLAFISESNKDKLFEVLFGEGIMNDSFSIVLFDIITKYYGIFTSWQMLFHFINTFFMSCFLGFIIGMCCSDVLKTLKKYNLQSIQEISIIIIFAFISYIVAELSELSAIISLLFCSIALSNYAFFNLSFLAREQSCIVVKIMASFCEGFIFTYLGLSFWTMMGKNYNIIFQCVQLLNIIIGRLITVYLITGINNSLTNDESSIFNSEEKKIISLSGCIRGAIAFGLAMTIETGDINKNSILLSTTLIIVLITTILFGPFIPHLLQKGEDEGTGSLSEGLLSDEEFTESQKRVIKFEHPNNEFLSSLIKKHSKLENEPKGLGSVLYKIDREYLKPLMIDNWEKTLNDHIRLTKIIKQELNKEEINKDELNKQD
jgi:sodium/hydrogen exchanger 8